MFGMHKNKFHGKFHRHPGHRRHGHGFSHRGMRGQHSLNIDRAADSCGEKPFDSGLAVKNDLCPICENHCVLSDPGCDKGLAYANRYNELKRGDHE